MPFGDGEASLTRCYAAAGPARCRQALLETLALPEDTFYLALSPAVLEKLASRYGAVRVGFSGAFTAEELAALGQTGNVQTLSVREASAFLTGLDEAGRIPPAHRAAARAAVWDAFFRQNLELLPASLPDALRAQSSALLTDFTAQDYARLGEILEFLANRAAPIRADALPAHGTGPAALIRSRKPPVRRCRLSSTFRPPTNRHRPPASRSPARTFPQGRAFRRSGQNHSTDSAAPPAVPPPPEGPGPAGPVSPQPAGAAPYAARLRSAHRGQKPRSAPWSARPAGPCRHPLPRQMPGKYPSVMNRASVCCSNRLTVLE